MKNRTRFAVVVSILLVAACTGGRDAPQAASPALPPLAASPPPATEPAGHADFERRLARARALRDEALAIPVPSYQGDRTKASHVAFMHEKVKDWYEVMRPATERAVDAYRAAYDAGDPRERALVASEAADLQATFCARMVRSSEAGEPEEWKTNPELHATYREGILGALAPFVKNAKITVDRCLADAAVDTAATRRCSAIRAELGPLEATPMPTPAPRPARPVSTSRTKCQCTPNDPLCSCL